MRAGSERGLGRARALGAAAAQVHTSDPPAKTHQSALPSRLDFERWITKYGIKESVQSERR